MDLTSHCPLAATLRVWQSTDGHRATIVAKGTYALEPETSVLATSSEALIDDGEPAFPRKARVAAAERAPFKRGAEVIVRGHARAPSNEGEARAVTSIVARVIVNHVRKTWSLQAPGAVDALPLPERGAEETTKSHLDPSQILDPERDDFFAGSPDEWWEGWSWDDAITIENLHPRAPSLTTKLSALSPEVTVERASGKAEPLVVTPDTLVIDADRGVAHVLWRGHFRLETPDEAGHVHVRLRPEEEARLARAWAERGLSPKTAAAAEPAPKRREPPRPLIAPPPDSTGDFATAVSPVFDVGRPTLASGEAFAADRAELARAAEEASAAAVEALRERYRDPFGASPSMIARPEGAGSQARRDKVRVRLASEDFACDDVQVRELTGTEAIGQLFSFHLEVVCIDGAELNVAEVLGASAQIVFEIAGEEQRTVHGMIAEVEDRLESESAFRTYHLHVVPRAFRSTLIETQEVFLDVSVPKLTADKLSLVGLGAEDVKFRLFGKYPDRDMIVQYKETDMAFVSRLAEHLGISAFFEQEEGRDVLVFTDENSGFPALPRGEVLTYRTRGERIDVFELSARKAVFPASYAVQDYNYRSPTVPLTSVHEAPAGFAGGVVEYGTHHKTPDEGRRIAEVRAGERESAANVWRGKSDVCRMTAGTWIRLSGHPHVDAGQAFLIQAVSHRVVQAVSIEGGQSEESYRNEFTLVAKDRAYRPARKTPRPRIHGVVTALVEPSPTGEIGKLAELDEQGRYTVRFYFDAGEPTERRVSSRLVRMIQSHAGPSYGMHFPLKPGIEVLMVFMDGDPDRPLIVGSVHNPITPSPVVADVHLMHRIETSTGLIFEMRDSPPRGGS